MVCSFCYIIHIMLSWIYTNSPLYYFKRSCFPFFNEKGKRLCNSYNLLRYTLLLPRPVVVITVSVFSLNSISSLEATVLDNPVNIT